MGPQTEATQHLSVSYLINQETKEWDLDKINLILPFHKDQILTLKPSVLGAADKHKWLKHPSGEYSTRSGYNAAAFELENSQPSNHLSSIEWIPNVWKQKTSPKIKMFLWKALYGALPVGEQLAIRQIPVATTCPRCNATETTIHLLFHCPFAQEVWKQAPLASEFSPMTITDFNSGLTSGKQLLTLPPTGLEAGKLFPWICWALWINRNQKIFNNRVFSADETILKATVDAREWNEAHDNSPPPQPKASIQRSPLRLEGTIKCCSDAAWNSESEFAGLG